MDGAAGARADAGGHSTVDRIALYVCNLTGVFVRWVCLAHGVLHEQIVRVFVWVMHGLLRMYSTSIVNPTGHRGGTL